MRVVIAGGGIAGVECALTIALGRRDTDVTLIHQWPSLRILPNLVYVPFGVSAHRLDIPIVENLEAHGIRCISGTVEQIDADARIVLVDGAAISYDKLVLAPGTEPVRVAARTLRSLDDALLLRGDLEKIERARHGDVTVLQLPENTWPAPGYELAALLGTWRRAYSLNDVSIRLVTSAQTPLGMFGIDAADVITGRLDELGVTVISGVPAGRVEELTDSGLTIDMIDLAARRIPGGPPTNLDGFYATGADGSIAPDMYAVGDAADLPFKAAFATSWQARRVLLAIGGDLRNLGANIDGVPVTECEYQMDLGNGSMVVRMPAREHLVGTWTELLAGEDTEIHDRPPDKLRGTLIRHYLLEAHADKNAARTFQELMREHDSITR